MDPKGLEKNQPPKNFMLCERNKNDDTMMALVMNGHRFVAHGVTAEDVEAFRRDMGRIMMAVNIHIEETDDQIAHNTARAEIFEMGVKHGAALAAPNEKARAYAVKTAMEQMRERNTQKPPMPAPKWPCGHDQGFKTLPGNESTKKRHCTVCSVEVFPFN